MRTLTERSLFAGRKFACAAIAVFLPVSLIADDSAAAMLHQDGTTLVNGNPAPPSIAIVSNDTIQTIAHHEASLAYSGSEVRIGPETVVQFEADELSLDHGILSTSTARELRVRVGCITIVPAGAAWTQYDVTDTDGKVTVVARKSDVKIESRGSMLQTARSPENQQMTIREGEQKTLEEGCGAKQRTPPDHLAGIGALLNSPWAIGIGAGGIVLGTCLEWCHSDDPVSPSMP